MKLEDTIQLHAADDKIVEKTAPYAEDKKAIISMLDSRTKLLMQKVQDMKASSDIDAGGPGSGRKSKYAKGLNQWKTPEKERALALKDPKQMKLPMKANQDNPESESGPITRQLGKKITKEGTQYCVYGDKDPLGCYPSKEKAMTVARGGSFITPDIPVGVTAAHFMKDTKQAKPSTPNKFLKRKVKAGSWEDPNKYGKHADITHHAYKTVKWTVDDADHTLLIPGNIKGERIRKKHRKLMQEANKHMVGGVVRAAGIKLPKVSSPGKVGMPSTPNTHAVHKMPKGVGHVRPNPSMHKGVGVGHRLPNPSFEATKIKADGNFGEPMAGNMSHAHLDTNMWFTPPSLAKRGKGNHTPTDDPGEKGNKFLDVTKRNSKDTNTQRMKLLKRSGPGGLPPQLPAHTTLIAPHTATYLSGTFASSMRRKRRNGGSFRAFGAAKI